MDTLVNHSQHGTAGPEELKKQEIYPLIQELPIRVKLFTFQQTEFDICAGLKDLGAEHRAKLDDALQLHMLNREVDDLEQWIL